MSDILDLNKQSGILDLNKALPSLMKLKGTLDWDPHPVHGASLSQGFDLDLFVFAVNSSNKISGGSDVCFFNNKSILNGSVSVPVDNRTGEGDEDEFVLADLPNVPSDKVALDLYVFVYEADKRGHNFGMIGNSRFHLIDEATGNTIQTYGLNQHVNATTVHLGRVQRSSSGWEFLPVGEAAVATANEVARAYM